MPDSPARSRRSPWFWNRIARRYARTPVADEAAYRHKLALTQQRLAPTMRVLEFACGTGSTALEHAPHVAHIDAIDFSAAMIDIARGKAQMAGVENVDFHVADIESWPAPPTPYDAILGMSILHLVADRRRILARVRAMLAPDGVFVSSTVCMGDATGMPGLAARTLLPAAGAIGVLPKVALLRADTLVKEIESAGFAIEEEWRAGPVKAVFIIGRAV